MATYPSAIYSPRTKANASGVVYDADDADRIFAEDVSKDDAEIVAIQTELGTLPKGSSASVKARLENIEATRDGFTDGGDPDGPDFSAGDFTKDDDWHELDLSSYIPAGTKLVLLRCSVMANAVNKCVAFRKHGNEEDYNVAACYTPAVDVFVSVDMWVAVDASRKIDYLVSAGTYTAILVNVGGYFK